MLTLFLICMSGTGWSAESPEKAAEEIVVYGDNFARWDDTRWSLSAEMIAPTGIVLGANVNRAFDSYALQMRAVIACKKDARLSKKKWEVSCLIEDVGLQASSQRRWKKERDRVIVEEILAEIDDKLTGADVQLQVDGKGGLTNLDLEGPPPRNQRERLIQENLRQVVSRFMAGFHLRVPENAQQNGPWEERNSLLMDMPSATASRGSTRLVHQVGDHDGYKLVQTIGEGTVSVARTVSRREPELDLSADVESAPGDRVLGQTPEVDDLEEQTESGGLDFAVDLGSVAESEIELMYTMEASGVAVFDPRTGVMIERIWTCQGQPTASSGDGIVTLPFRNIGRIRMLDKDETVDVGPTRQVSPPASPRDGLPAWTDIGDDA